MPSTLLPRALLFTVFSIIEKEKDSKISYLFEHPECIIFPQDTLIFREGKKTDMG